MKRQEGLVTTSPVPTIPQYLTPPGGQEEPPGMLHMARRFLRGRYHWLAVLGLVLGGIGAVAGYKTWSPMYQSQGQIHVLPTLPRVLYSIDDQFLSGGYESYMQTQAALMGGSRVIDYAMQQAMASDEWRRLGRTLTDQARHDFHEHLRVKHSEGSQFIHVSFTDEDPDAARLAVKSVIDAYMAIVVDEQADARENVLQRLNSHATTLKSELAVIQKRVQDEAGKFGPDSVQWRYNQMLSALSELEKQRDELKGQHKQITQALADPAGKTGDLPPLEIAQRDPAMRDLLKRVEQAKAEMDELLRYRRAEHPAVQAAAKHLFNAEEQADEYARTYNRLAKESASDPKGPLQSGLAAVEEQQKAVDDQITQTEEQIRVLAEKSQRIREQNEDLSIVKAQLQEAQRRLEMKSVEEVALQDRVRVLSDGERPGLPINRDDKSKRAIMWGGGGASVAFGLVLLLGASDRRHRYVDDAIEVLKNQPLLGVVPNMSRKKHDPEQTAIAAMGVNQIRAMLQLGALSEQRRTFAITSGNPGEGKTSLAVALGMSFAHSGTRTLLIDFDLVGRSLSARCDRINRERIGELLVKSNAITPAQLQEAIDTAAERSTRLGEALVSLGHITQEEIDSALSRQAASTVGLPDALDGAPLNRCVVTVGQGPRTLSILPSGFATAQYISSLSPLKIRELLQRAKREYDVVLVDSGPLPGSLEAAIVSTLVDEVLVVVSQGTHRAMASRALEHLNRMNARVAGIVFNRAMQSCVERYGSSSQVSRWQEDLFSDVAGGPESAAASERFGPLVSATASYRADEMQPTQHHQN